MGETVRALYLVGDRWRDVEGRGNCLFQSVIFVESNDDNPSAMTISARLWWSAKKEVEGVMIFDVGRDCET